MVGLTRHTSESVMEMTSSKKRGDYHEKWRIISWPIVN